MKLVEQTSFGSGKWNCFSACLASILELPIEDVPNFCHEEADHDGTTWLERTAAWLGGRGWGFVLIPWAETSEHILPVNCWLICLGKQAGGEEQHAVIGRCETRTRQEGREPGTWKVEYDVVNVYDPNPRRSFLESVASVIALVPGCL